MTRRNRLRWRQLRQHQPSSEEITCLLCGVVEPAASYAAGWRAFQVGQDGPTFYTCPGEWPEGVDVEAQIKVYRRLTIAMRKHSG